MIHRPFSPYLLVMSRRTKVNPKSDLDILYIAIYHHLRSLFVCSTLRSPSFATLTLELFQRHLLYFVSVSLSFHLVFYDFGVQ
jgi:hypothetical protein